MVPPEAMEETMMIDGKPYVRSKNPYWLSYPDAPEYLYVPKGKEFVGLQQHMINAMAKAVGREQAKAAGKAVPPDKLQEMVRAEVDRILREEGLGSFMSQGRGEKAPYIGRAAAVIPDLDTPPSYEGLNRTLAVALGDALGRQKDIKISSQDQIREAMTKAAAEAGAQMEARGRAENDQAVVTMKKNKLVVHPATAEAEAEWRRTAEAVYSRIRGAVVPADMFDEVVRVLAQYRARPRK